MSGIELIEKFIKDKKIITKSGIEYIKKIIITDKTMILNVRKNTVSYKNNVYHITNKQKKLLLLLSDNELHTISDIKEYMGYTHTQGIRTHFNNISELIYGIEIYKRKYTGYALNTKVLIDY